MYACVWTFVVNVYISECYGDPTCSQQASRGELKMHAHTTWTVEIKQFHNSVIIHMLKEEIRLPLILLLYNNSIYCCRQHFVKIIV